jgi:hypothetical protein
MKSPITRIIIFLHALASGACVLFALPHIFVVGVSFYRALHLDQLVIFQKCLITYGMMLTASDSFGDLMGVYFSRFVVAAPFIFVALAIYRVTLHVAVALAGAISRRAKPTGGDSTKIAGSAS